MKHYFVINPLIDGTTVKVFAPVTGVITDLQPEGSGGTQIRIKSAAHPAFRFYILGLCT